jgi:glycosyltransferase involved in cell wall biosynthesis
VVAPGGGALNGRELAAARALLFPTTYEHEAQPLVVFEAAEMGAVPVVWAAGWIPEQMAALGLSRFVLERGDVDGLVTACQELLALPDAEFAAISAQVTAAFRAHAAAARAQLGGVLGRSG